MAQDVGEILVTTGSITPEQLRDAQVQSRGGQNLTDVIVRMGIADETTVWRACAKSLNLPFVDLQKGKIVDEVLAKIPKDFAIQQGVLPILEKGGKLIVAIDDGLKRI